MIPKVLYLSHADEALYDLIREAAGEDFEVLTLEADDDGERVTKLADADAVIVASKPFTRPLIEAARKLAFVHHQGVGFQDTIDLEALAERATPLAITPGGTTVGVAEHAVLLMLATLRRLPYADSELRQGRYHINALRPHSRELSGRTVGFLGMGRIGQATAERLKPFGITGLYHDPAVALPADRERALGATAAGFDDLLAQSDIVSLHMPLTPTTRHIIDAGAIARMKAGAILINTARGGLVDEAALAAALLSGRLAGAGLDVQETEPPAPDNPLLGLPNVVLTPHISAGTRDAFQQKMDAIFANLAAFFAGRPPENLVDYVSLLRRSVTA
ncbi:MAG TPA: 2-hydroxyacid dehydrogenase [Aestuariivirgaceae bacterium]|nr:2-hydroxyacid dehydrogenase [Aestuariivirgaceae bacterium]